ncbi:hypothetical protein AWC11_12095 [Mycobacterium interjectum]|nr:hypothetical protein AWC11_12095 [Mycobacterium interjectum]
MSEEKDEATMAEEQAMVHAGQHADGVEDGEGVPPQVTATPGMPVRKAVERRRARVREMLHTLPPKAAAGHPGRLGADTASVSAAAAERSVRKVTRARRLRRRGLRPRCAAGQ